MFNGNLWDFFLTMMIIFFWVIAFTIWFQAFFDVWRRNDLSGGMKAVWTLVLFVIPWIGVLIYMIARPKMTAQDVQTLVRAEAAAKAAGTVSTADELDKLVKLKDANVITEAQYEDLKAKILA
jgi:hypothetical protein